MKPIVTWIVAADGTRARVFENRGPGKGLRPVPGLSFDQPHLKAQDIVTDKPGRAFSSVGHGRSAIEPHTDPVDHEEEIFARMIAHILEAKWNDHSFDRLIIAAEPAALGKIRRVLCPAVDRAVMGELQRDLTNVPLPAIASHFDNMLAL
ncbi:MAG TPA: host attachment protein [Devosiaceae bacterium]|nr:host attachment protein [Devosiaceae bacterium]